MEKRRIRVGSRESRLAVIQAEMVMEAIAREHPELSLELVTMKTTGDIILDRTLDKVGGKGLFVKELDKALRDGRVDISVHSLKDMPMEVPEDLPLLAFSTRKNPLDAWVLPKGATSFDPGKPIGSSSPRRCLQLQQLYPGCEIKSVRGNLQTRLEKLDSGEYGALVLACAGLERLGLQSRISKVFTADEMIPAAGQGILCVQGRAGEDYSWLDGVDCPQARVEALAERAFVTYLDGGCSSPMAAFARVKEGRITIKGLYCDDNSGDLQRLGAFRTGEIRGSADCAEALARQLASELKGDESIEHK